MAAVAADADAVWNQIGMDDPNDISVYFGYAVAIGNPATTFTATATRTAVNDGGGNVGTTVTLDETGTFGGTHPFVPT